MTTRWRRVLLVGLGLAAASCAAPAPLLPLPMPSVWEGPEEFQAPRVRIQPGAVLVLVETCATEKGTTVTEKRFTGLRRTLRGQTEIGMDLDGRRIGDLVMDDTGTIVDIRTDAKVGEAGPALMSLLLEAQAARVKALRRAHPVHVSVPIESFVRAVLVAGFTQEGFEIRTLTVPPMEITTEYLGHMDLERGGESYRVAGYRWRERVTNARVRMKRGAQEKTADLEIVADGFSYVDAYRGVEIANEVATQLSLQVGSQRVDERQRCQTHFQPKASRGL